MGCLWEHPRLAENFGMHACILKLILTQYSPVVMVRNHITPLPQEVKLLQVLMSNKLGITSVNN